MVNRSIFKILIPLFIMFIITGCSVNQLNKVLEPKEFVYERENISVELLNTINEIVDAMSKDNIVLLNEKFVNQKFGVYNFYKIDGIETFTHQKLIYNIISNDTEEFSHLIRRVNKTHTTLPILIENVKFDCSPNDDKYYGWNKNGIFIDNDVKPLLSKYMAEINKFEKDKYKKEEFHKAKLIEKTGYRVVLTPEIVFDMIKIENKWYIALIDRITTDCSSPKKEN